MSDLDPTMAVDEHDDTPGAEQQVSTQPQAAVDADDSVQQEAGGAVVRDADTDAVDGDDAAGDDATAEDGDVEDGDERPARSNRTQQLDAEGDIAADYLEELLDIADLDGDIDTYTEGGRAHVSIVTDADLLVGRDGEVLEALQELARLAVMTETGHRSRLMLDVAGYRDKQRKELRALALEAIEEVRQTGEATALAPMNPFERKIVHDAVAEAGLNSESEGVEPRRHVVVLPA